MQDKLLALINTLTPSEVRYFKQFSGRTQQTAEKNYLHLFDEIVSLNPYNEQVLVANLMQKGIAAQFLAADKNYLYKQLLRSLQAYHSHTSATLQIVALLAQIELLYQRSLYDPAYKMVEKAKEIATIHHLIEHLLLLLQWERKIVGANLAEEKTAYLFAQIDEQTARVQNLNDFNKLFYSISLLRKKLPKLRTQAELDSLATFMQNPLLAHIEQAKSFFAQIRYYEIYANYYYLTNQKTQEFYANAALIAQYNERYIAENTANYVAHYSRYLRLQALIEPQNFAASLVHFQQIPDKLRTISPYLKAQVAILAAGIAMNHAIRQHQFEQCLSLQHTEQAILQQHARFVSDEQKVIAYYRFVYVFFIVRNYALALDYANTIINDFSENIRPDIRFYTRLLQLIMHYENSHYQLLPYLIRTARQALAKRKTLQQSEKIILSFLGKLAHQYPNFDWRELLQPLKQKLQKSFQQNPFNQIVLDYFDITAWVDSKQRNLPFREVLEKG